MVITLLILAIVVMKITTRGNDDNSLLFGSCLNFYNLLNGPWSASLGASAEKMVTEIRRKILFFSVVYYSKFL